MVFFCKMGRANIKYSLFPYFIWPFKIFFLLLQRSLSASADLLRDIVGNQ